MVDENEKSLFDQVGSREIIEKIHKKFYDDLYDHPVLSKFFEETPQEIIEKQQTDFMIGSMGGPKSYRGKNPVKTHLNMYITEELFDLRHRILEKAIREVGTSLKDEVIERWLTIDYAFKSAIVKKSIDECQRLFNTQEILAFDKDGKKIAA
jgi:hemoglobin